MKKIEQQLLSSEHFVYGKTVNVIENVVIAWLYRPGGTRMKHAQDRFYYNAKCAERTALLINLAKEFCKD